MFCNGKITKHQKRSNSAKSLNDLIFKYIDIRDEAYDFKLDEYLKIRNSSFSFRFYLRKEITPADQNKYIRLDGCKSLEENLKGTTIIEYPCIHVALPCHIFNYESVSIDDIKIKP